MKPYKEQRPWGDFIRFTHNEVSTVKIITVKEGEQTSLQFHHKRSEFWRILADGVIVVNDKEIQAKKGDEFFIKPEEKHQIKGPIEILEISLGEFDEADIVRLEDKYGR